MVAVVQEGLLLGPGGGLLFDPPFDLAKHACHVAGQVVLYQPLDGIRVIFQPVEQLVQHFCLVLGRSRLEQGEMLLEPLEGDHPHAECGRPLDKQETEKEVAYADRKRTSLSYNHESERKYTIS